MAVAGWVSLVATGSSLGANFVVECVALVQVHCALSVELVLIYGS